MKKLLFAFALLSAMTLAQTWTAPLEPRHPPVPDGIGINPVDRFLGAYLREKNTPAPRLVSDAIFLRRAYYDVTGLPPAPADIAAFLHDARPGKRGRLIEKLLSDSRDYAENWISFWNDLLRNDQGVNYAGTRKSITPWLRHALETNMAYGAMVSELVNPVGTDAPDGFLLGVNWRGSVNASQTPYMQASQNTAQVFLGVNLKCASCHDSFINRYKLKQSYGLAALFAEADSLELVRCDVNTGKWTDPEFLFPELGGAPKNAPLSERRAAAAAMFTSPRDGRLTRTMVNRLWERLIGRGLVEPVDDMDARPWYPDLLDWLAFDFADRGYDLKHLLKRIMTSRAYQMPSIPGAPDRTQSYVFRGPQVRRLSAEQFMDTVSALTGEWRILQEDEGARFSREWELKSTALTRAMGRPIRDQVFTTRNEDATTLQAIELMNGDTLGRALRRGARRLLAELPPSPVNVFDSRALGHGSVSLDIDIHGVKQLWLLAEDAGSYDPAQTGAGWLDMELSGPRGTANLSGLATLSKFEKRALAIEGAGREAMAVPVGATLIFNVDGMGFTRLRGSVGVDDAGKRDDVESSVRFFVFTKEPDRDELVGVVGAPPAPAPKPAKTASGLIDRLFLQALAREPSPRERVIAMRFLGGAQRISVSGLEDLLWSLLMHPELQYIY